MIIHDQQRLTQMILNLQSNAIKFTEQGTVSIICSISNNTLRVEVKDTGVGISQSNQLKLFKLFGFINDTKDKNVNGIGLGLMITQQLVHQYGGKIGVESELGKGSMFFIELSLDEKQDQNNEEKESNQLFKFEWQAGNVRYVNDADKKLNNVKSRVQDSETTSFEDIILYD